MADRARSVVLGDSAQVALWRKLELFPTPPWAARAGGELIEALDAHEDDRRWSCWEPACGTGTMAHGLGDYFSSVYASDIHDHGWDGIGSLCDFLEPDRQLAGGVDWIVTNPPFAKAAEFVEAGLRRARRGVAILARVAFMESVGRYELFFPRSRGRAGLTLYAPFFERVPMTLGRWDPKASTATAYAWFVWMQPDALAETARRTRRLWSAGDPVVRPIPPGTRERLTRPDDMRLFGARAAGPDLFTDHQGRDR